MTTGNTAILFFSRTQQDEFCAKSLGLNRNRFGRLFKFFTNKALATARQTGIPVIESYSDQQQGQTFSERLTNELQSVAKQGFENVIIIGNDAPGLSREDLELANHQLGQGKNVLGKDKRGGDYLIGISLRHFDLSLLKQIEWHSSAVHRQLSEQLSSVYELAQKTDINNVRDIKQLIRTVSELTSGAIAYLRQLFFRTHLPVSNYSFIGTSVVTRPAHRGPPWLIH